MKPRSGASVLLFGLTAGQEKLVRTAGLKWGLRCRTVPQEYYNRTLLQLVSGKQAEVPAYSGPVPQTAALLLAGVPSSVLQPFLQQLRKAGLPTSVLKAVLTEQNSSWTAVALLEELAQEHAALAAGSTPVHRA